MEMEICRQWLCLPQRLAHRKDRGAREEDAQCNVEKKSRIRTEVDSLLSGKSPRGRLLRAPFSLSAHPSHRRNWYRLFFVDNGRNARFCLLDNSVLLNDRTRILEFAGNEDTQLSSYYKHISGEKACRRLTKARRTPGSDSQVRLWAGAMSILAEIQPAITTCF